MDFLKQYWWIVLIGVILALVIGGRKSASGSGATVQQIGNGVDSNTLAQLDSAERMADLQTRAGLIDRLLNFVQFGQNLSATERISAANNDAAVQIAHETQGAQSSLQAAQIAAQQQIALQQYQLQQQALNNQNAASSRNAWLNGIFGAAGTFLPALGGIFSNGSSSGGFGSGGFGGIGTGATGGWSGGFGFGF